MIAAKGRFPGYGRDRPAGRSAKSAQMRDFASKKDAQRRLSAVSAAKRPFSRWVRISFYKSAIRIGRCTGSFGSIRRRASPASVTPRPSDTRATRDRGADLGHIEGVVVRVAVTGMPPHIGHSPAFARKVSFENLRPTRIVGVSAFRSTHADTPNRRP